MKRIWITGKQHIATKWEESNELMEELRVFDWRYQKEERKFLKINNVNISANTKMEVLYKKFCCIGLPACLPYNKEKKSDLFNALTF